MSEQQPTFVMILADYFRERLTDVSGTLAPVPQEDTLWYLGNMLARFGQSDQFFNYEQGRLSIRPLALLYQDAREAEDRRQRCLILRQLGDMSLFLGALFPEKFARRGIRQEYFVGMGGSAYDYLAEFAQHSRHVFQELANTFNTLLQLIARVCIKQTLFDAADAINLYYRWRNSGDPYLAEQLHQAGIAVSTASPHH
ncbi:hypothetical protein [Halioxenophilus sp. WMMB6]|uniref:hypothetical protein n=1 Tax=Halioxenophilus sp. WMMB6 TaxID=3073815 RepID=UPI00295F5A18|nr:hypothetical protein [Halioxenophilus sp. WMMB6]